MDFTLTETQLAVADLARQVLADHGGHDRAVDIEAGDGIDTSAWKALGATGLLSAIVDEDGGVVAAAQLAIEVGRQVVTVPAWALLTALLTLGDAELDDARTLRLLEGGEMITLALHESGVPEVRRMHTSADDHAAITGIKPTVAGLAAATGVLVAASGYSSTRLHLVDTGQPEVTVEPVRTTDRSNAAHLHLDGAASIRIGDEVTLRRAEQVAIVLVCATLIGLCEQATAGAASYISTREQFGRRISSFQAPLMRLADAHIDLECLRVTMLRAAWCLDTGREADAEVSVAKWWAAEGAHRILSTAQHLHGGIGADISYPAHRYFLRGKQLIDTLGGAAVHADRLGTTLAERVMS
jgi:alkylation response protein AidB-like acyl-CoA dehydrogenase